MQTRFPGGVPEEVIETISSQPNLPMLLDWVQHALTAATLEEIVAVLRR